MISSPPMADPLEQTLVASISGEVSIATTESASDPALSLPSGSVKRKVLAGRYEIWGLLGAGGMGSVYRARDMELDEMVALKVLRPELASVPDTLERFRREVKLARKVTHPNVARVFDVGEDGGEKFLTMELVEGESLSDVIAREGPLGIARAVSITMSICAGLAAAHAAGVVHRDLKPDNILLDRAGRVVVTDFGIARVAASDARTNAITGTPAYMSPEQVRGQPADTRADIYALGVVLYELLTGARAWQGDTVLAIATARVFMPPPDPRAIRADIPPALGAITMRCMATDREGRYPTVEALTSDLAVLTMPVMALPPMPLPSAAPSSPAASATIASDSGVRVALSPAARSPADLPSDTSKRVAVLPFRYAGSPDHDYLADGLTDDLIDVLSMTPGVRVCSRGAVSRVPAEGRDAREIGRDLAVQIVIEGSVRKAPAGLRVSARIISVEDGFQLWAKRFDRPEAEILAVSDDLAAAVKEALTVNHDAPARKAPTDPEALDLYLRARSLYHRFFHDMAGQSVALFEKALERAPNDPRILAGYAMARARLWKPDPRASEMARRAAERAVELAPELPESHVALAVVRYQGGDESGAIKPARHALRLAPWNAEAHDLLGRILAEAGHFDAARWHLETCLSIEPTVHVARTTLSRMFALRDAWDRTYALLDLPTDREIWISYVARVAVWRRDREVAQRLLGSFEATSPAGQFSNAMFTFILTGADPTKALSFMQDPSVVLRTRCMFTQIEAECAAFVGDYDRSLAAVERAASSAGLFDLAWMKGCQILEPIREHPRFLAVRVVVSERAARIIAEYTAPEA